jgi:hypothetical protein
MDFVAGASLPKFAQNTVEPMSPKGFVRTAAHTSQFPRQPSTPFWQTTAAHQPVVITGTRFQVAQNLHCWQTLCNELCCDINIRLVTINVHILLHSVNTIVIRFLDCYQYCTMWGRQVSILGKPSAVLPVHEPGTAYVGGHVSFVYTCAVCPAQAGI